MAGKETLYQRVIRGSLHEQIAEQIQARILNQQLSPGDRLPAERELCDHFGVSRTVVREATKALAERGLVDVQPGRGTFVAAITHNDVTESIGLFLRFSPHTHHDLMEAREFLELTVAHLAAERAKPENLKKMQDAVEAMAARLDDPEAYIQADQDFHVAMAEATQNPIFVLFTNALVDLLREIRQLGFQAGDAWATGQKDHLRILQALTSGDAAATEEAVRTHMELIRKMQVDAKEPPTDEEGGSTNQ